MANHPKTSSFSFILPRMTLCGMKYLGFLVIFVIVYSQKILHIPLLRGEVQQSEKRPSCWASAVQQKLKYCVISIALGTNLKTCYRTSCVEKINSIPDRHNHNLLRKFTFWAHVKIICKLENYIDFDNSATDTS